MPKSAPSERAIVFCVGAVQFVNILDFMMVMPMGPDFAKALGIPLSHLGYVGGSYTAAASVSGLCGVFFLERFDRRPALAVAMVGLFVGTLSGAFAQGLASLMTARVVAGAFGGPATSLAYSIIADVVPAERRGKAMGAVMGAFSIASVLGVPAGLELARRGGWQMPFVAVGILGAIIGVFAYGALPSMRGHLSNPKRNGEKSAIWRELTELVRVDTALSLLMTFLVMASGFVLIPNISAYMLGNLHYPRERLGLLYLAGGAVSFFTMRLVGFLVDRHGSARVGTFGTLFIALVVYAGFVCEPPLLPVMLIFVGFMFGSSFRNVAYNTLTTKVPAPTERARFASVQSAVQHLSAALGGFASAQLLTERADHSLSGISTCAWASIGAGLAVPPLLWTVEARVRRNALRAT